ncbi:MAG: peptide MFS transporter, partial [Pirellulales bacterium]|nr:peptide MFS transporter [Pirellulales bacterium]
MSESTDSNDMSASPEVAQVKAAKGQPKGLWVLFITEMWERFSYYGMRALLVFYLISKLSAANPGFGWTEKSAQLLLAVVTSAVYFTPMFGGWLADKYLGTHRSLLFGGWIMAIGQALLFLAEYWGAGENVDVVLLSTAPAPLLTFMLGLVLIVLGTGLFKPCVSVMVGQLYGADDPRRDSGFTIFYMGINVGAFMSTLVAGTIGETYGWHWGFGSAAAGMTLGLIVYQVVRPFYLKGIGLPPHHEAQHEEGHEPTPEEIEQARIDEYERTRPLTRVDWDRMAVIVVLAVFGIVFWVAFEQAASSLNLFALHWTDRRVFGHEFPATWYQSVNPAAIVILAPLFAGLWAWLDRRGLQPSTPVKFGLGLGILSLAYVPMVFGSLEAGSPKPIILSAAPAAVQKTIAPILDRLEKEKKEDAAKKEKERSKEGKDAQDSSNVSKEAADSSKAGSEKGNEEEEVKFDVLDELSYENEHYYGVGYVDRQAIILELYDAEGRLVRRDATRKQEKDSKRKAVENNTPEDVTLDQVPETARNAILGLSGDRQVKSVQSVVKAKEPAFVATWLGDNGEMAAYVGPDGLVLGVDSGALAHVGRAGPQ